MKTIRNIVATAFIMLMSAGSLHATPFGCDPSPQKGKKPTTSATAIVVSVIASYLGL